MALFTLLPLLLSFLVICGY